MNVLSNYRYHILDLDNCPNAYKIIINFILNLLRKIKVNIEDCKKINQLFKMRDFCEIKTKSN